MAYTYDQLKGMTVAELREIAAGVRHDTVQGYAQLNKEHLLVALAKALNIDTHTRGKLHVDKAGVKLQMKELRKKRDAALDAHRSRLRAEARQEGNYTRFVARCARQQPLAGEGKK